MEQQREKERLRAEERAAARASRRQVEALVSEPAAQITEPGEYSPAQPELEFAPDDIPICPLEPPPAPEPVPRRTVARPAPEPRHVSANFRLPTSDLLNEPPGRNVLRRAGAQRNRRAREIEIRGVQRAGLGGADQPRPGGHHFRIQARSRHQVQPHHDAQRGPLPGAAGGIHPDRAHSGKTDRGHRSPQLAARADRLARSIRVGGVRGVAIAADHLAGEGHQRPHSGGGARYHAAPADRRLDRFGQERHDQLADHVGAVQIDAGRCAHDSGGPEAPRAGPLRRHPASADAGDHRCAESHQRAAQRGA